MSHNGSLGSGLGHNLLAVIRNAKIQWQGQSIKRAKVGKYLDRLAVVALRRTLDFTSAENWKGWNDRPRFNFPIPRLTFAATGLSFFPYFLFPYPVSAAAQACLNLQHIWGRPGALYIFGTCHHRPPAGARWKHNPSWLHHHGYFFYHWHPQYLWSSVCRAPCQYSVSPNPPLCSSSSVFLLKK